MGSSEHRAVRGLEPKRIVAPERLSISPDCGLSQTARWAAQQKLANLVAGTRHVRESL